MSLILRQIIGYQQGKRAVSLTADPELKKQLEETKKQLKSILTKWKFGDQPLKTSQEFLNKFEPWINTQLQEQKELKDFLEEEGAENLPKLKETWQNTEADYLKRIEELQANHGEIPEDYETLQTEIQTLKDQLATYARGEDWETQTGKIITDLEQEIRSITEVLNKTENEVKDLTTERDEAIREQKTAEQEVLAKNNQLKNKNKEADNKAKEIERLKKEKSQSEIALNKKLEELKKKYSKQGKLLDEEQCENNKLTEKIEELERKLKAK